MMQPCSLLPAYEILDKEETMSEQSDTQETTIEQEPAADLEQRLRLVERERNVLAMQVSQRDKTIHDLERQLARQTEEMASRREGPPIRWLSLLFGVLLLVPVPLLVGYGLTFYREQQQAWYWPLIAGLIALGLTLVGLFFFVRFLLDVGLLRVAAIVAGGLVVASLVTVAFAGRGLVWNERVGTAVAKILGWIDKGVVAYVDAFLNWGKQVAHFVMRQLGS